MGNIGMSLMPILIGYIHDMTETINYGYFWVEFVFIVFGIWAFILIIILYYWDLNNRGGILSSKNTFEQFSKY